MKLKTHTGLDVSDSSGVVSESNVELTQKETAHIIRALSDSIYQNKPGSMVREMASNAWDANNEVNSTDPVFLEIKNDQIIFKDSGPGFSKERMEKVFNRLGGSTKRHTNDQIGGFGIGSKTPLAYTTDFTLKTWVDNVRYVYIIHKTEALPKVLLVEETEDTHPNGTEAIVSIKPGDMHRIHTAIREQLLYFDNLVIIGMPSWKNDFELITGTHYVYNTFFSPSETNICLGQVAYPLQRSSVTKMTQNPKYQSLFKRTTNDMVQRFMDLKIGLRFNNGDLPVTLSRESIEYSDGVEEVIWDKLAHVIKEFETVFLKQKTDDMPFSKYCQYNPSVFIELGDHHKDLSFLNFQHPPSKQYPKFQKRLFDNDRNNYIEYLGASYGKVINKTDNYSITMAGSSFYPKRQIRDLLASLEAGQSLKSVYLLGPNEMLNRRTAAYAGMNDEAFFIKDRATTYLEKCLDKLQEANSKLNPGEKKLTPDSISDLKWWELLKKELFAAGMQKFSDIKVPEDFTLKKLVDGKVQVKVYKGSAYGTQYTLQNLSLNTSAILIPHANVDDYWGYSREFDITIVACRADLYHELINDSRFMTFEDYTKTPDFRRKITCFYIASNNHELQSRELVRDSWNSVDVLAHLSDDEKKILQDIKAKIHLPDYYRISSVIDPFIEYIEKEDPSFFLEEVVNMAKKLIDIYQCEARVKTECLKDSNLRAQIYSKILKDPLTNEFIKNNLIHKTGKQQTAASS